MITVLLILHLMIAASLVGVVLLQRSEGGALGIGGGGGGFLTGRSAGNALTTPHAIRVPCFFATSLVLAILAGQHGGAPSILSPGGGGGLAPLQMPSSPAPAAPGAPAALPAPQAPQSQ